MLSALCSLFLGMYGLEHLNTGLSEVDGCSCLMSPVLSSWEEEENTGRGFMEEEEAF